MIYCEQYKLNVNISQNCENKCIFWDIKKKKCKYLLWIPGLKKGRDLTNEK